MFWIDGRWERKDGKILSFSAYVELNLLGKKGEKEETGKVMYSRGGWLFIRATFGF